MLVLLHDRGDDPMAIGERIKFIRNLRGLTQKALGLAIGFEDNTADVRIAQYESGTRSPKEKYTLEIANALNVSSKALDVPDIDSDIGLAHTLFTLEDLYGIQVSEIDGEVCLRLDKSRGDIYLGLFELFNLWNKEADKLKNGEITKEEYDQWRYAYPTGDSSYKKVPSKKFSDALVEKLTREN